MFHSLLRQVPRGALRVGPLRSEAVQARLAGRGHQIVCLSTEQGSPQKTGTSNMNVSGCEKEKRSPAAGRVHSPQESQTFAPEGKGMDPAENGKWLKPGETGLEDNQKDKVVEDKLTGEKLRDTEVIADRRTE